MSVEQQTRRDPSSRKQKNNIVNPKRRGGTELPIPKVFADGLIRNA